MVNTLFKMYIAFCAQMGYSKENQEQECDFYGEN